MKMFHIKRHNIIVDSRFREVTRGDEAIWGNFDRGK
jgi:hypothetical protein